ncbi:Short-chain dehydrogenase/reductase SDR [Nitrospira japonica]|uniref:Short-chain dehydrogenase/reductase SDR n=1 Tax=Nitrospira japonica TaxID=1325564 RepID=A0A1W1I2F9_9BACT|nr:SDR family oxidoreductase [Nitrospira japonica]SLM47188.1 Short-chain dehydrogenase/reductase SDR [Nitrospira japonica]
MPTSLSGKVVLIAGGGGALGGTIVPAFVRSGARVISADRNPPPEQVIEGKAMKADVADKAAVHRLLEDVIRTAGRLDVLVNLVGGFAAGRIADTDVSLWHRMLAVNLTPAFLLSKAALPHMTARGSGRLLHVAAWAAVEPFDGAGAYIVAKSGLLALIRVLALELKGSGVTVNGVLPTTIDTPANRANMPEANPSSWTKPESIAELLTFLASDGAGQISGAAIPIGAHAP